MDLKSAVQELVESINDNVDAVIVEGRSDADALQKAGVTATIYTCSETDGLVAFARRVTEEDRIAILTDFDTEGKQLNGRLRDLIPGSHVQAVWRKKMGKLLTEHGRRDLESLNNVFEE